VDSISGLGFALPNFLYLAGIHMAICMVAIYAVSIATGGPDATQLESTIWTIQDYRAETVSLQDLPWYKNYRYQALGLIIVVATILIWFA